MQEKSIIERNYQTIGYSLGGCLAEIITLPIYAVKTNYQTSNKSTKQITTDIYKNYGIIGFYNSITSAILAKILSSFLKYLIYNEIKYYRQTNDKDLINNMFNGCLTGLFCSCFVHPIDVITNNLQRFNKLNRNMFKAQFLYSGFSQTLIRNFTLYSFLFPVFDYSKYLTDNNILLSCIMTTSISTTILQPTDYLRTRFMAQQKNEIGGMKILIKNFKSCWKGYHLNYIANSSHFTIAMLFSHYFSNNITNYYKK
jgi:hypothetical protein